MLCKAKKIILCLKSAVRICFAVRIWFSKIQAYSFFFFSGFY